MALLIFIAAKGPSCRGARAFSTNLYVFRDTGTLGYGVSVVNNIARGLTIPMGYIQTLEQRFMFPGHGKYNKTRGIASSKMTAMLESFQLKY
jgi:hypothetical protein